MCWLSAHKGEHVWAHSSKSERERQIECRLLLGAPSIFVGTPSTWSEKPIISLTYFFLKKNARLSPVAFRFILPHSIFFSSSSDRFLLLLPHFSHFRIVLAHLTGEKVLLLQPPLLSWRGACREEVVRCIEEVSVKSNAIVHRRGSFVTVHRRGKRRNHVVSTIVPELGWSDMVDCWSITKVCVTDQVDS